MRRFQWTAAHLYVRHTLMADTSWYIPFQKKEDELRPKVQGAIDFVLKSTQGETPKIQSHLFYGAIGIDPKHLVIWYLFNTDSDKCLSETSGHMNKIAAMTMQALKDRNYPYHSVDIDRICFASEEEIQRAGGHRAFFQ